MDMRLDIDIDIDIDMDMDTGIYGFAYGCRYVFEYGYTVVVEVNMDSEINFMFSKDNTVHVFSQYIVLSFLYTRKPSISTKCFVLYKI
jgi:hypothetical protein